MDNESTILIDGKRLRRLREQRKLTQLYLATAVEVSTETISRWENNRSPSIKRDNAQKLAEILEVTLDDLVQPEISGASVPSPRAPVRAQVSPRFMYWRRLSPRQWLAGAALVFALVGSLMWFFERQEVQPKVSAYRFLPDHCLPNQPFPVLIRLEMAGQVNSFMLREKLPDHSNALNTRPLSVITQQAPPQLKWVLAGEHRLPVRVAYLLQTKKFRIGERILFSGSLILGHRGTDEPSIQGKSTIEVSCYHWADENKDNRIDDYEMLSVFDLFSEDDRLGLNMEEMKAIWAGHGYRWDQEHEKLEIL